MSMTELYTRIPGTVLNIRKTDLFYSPFHEKKEILKKESPTKFKPGPLDYKS